jgi:hypothetical protein
MPKARAASPTHLRQPQREEDGPAGGEPEQQLFDVGANFLRAAQSKNWWGSAPKHKGGSAKPSSGSPRFRARLRKGPPARRWSHFARPLGPLAVTEAEVEESHPVRGAA